MRSIRVELHEHAHLIVESDPLEDFRGSKCAYPLWESVEKVNWRKIAIALSDFGAGPGGLDLGNFGCDSSWRGLT